MNANSIFYNQNFGVEVELTGITRSRAASLIAEYFGGNTGRRHDGYDTYTASDREGRIWKCMSDASIECETRNGISRPARSEYACEVVTPILHYSDLEDLQEIVRILRRNGAIANNSCGIHVHVDGANHDAYSLTRLMNMMLGRQNLIYEALDNLRRESWCKKCHKPIVDALKKCDKNRSTVERIWYSSVNDNYRGYIDHSHYNETRYHGVNLHAFFTKGTVEFRLFNGTTHAGKIKAYVQFCLAMSAYALQNRECLTAHFESTDNKTAEQKAVAMENFLTKRLGLTGKEFATCRTHLTAAFRPAVADTEVA